MKKIVGSILIGVALLAGCGSSSHNATATQSTSTPVPTATTPPYHPVHPAKTVVLTTQSGRLAFVPNTVTVKVNQIVEIDNKTKSGHFIITKYFRFPLRVYGWVQMKFSAPGKYTYYDKTHPNIKGYVVVKKK